MAYSSGTEINFRNRVRGVQMPPPTRISLLQREGWFFIESSNLRYFGRFLISHFYCTQTHRHTNTHSLGVKNFWFTLNYTLFIPPLLVITQVKGKSKYDAISITSSSSSCATQHTHTHAVLQGVGDRHLLYAFEQGQTPHTKQETCSPQSRSRVRSSLIRNHQPATRQVLII